MTRELVSSFFEKHMVKESKKRISYLNSCFVFRTKKNKKRAWKKNKHKQQTAIRMRREKAMQITNIQS